MVFKSLHYVSPDKAVLFLMDDGAAVVYLFA